MPFTQTEIAGVELFTPNIFYDERGHFYEAFRATQIPDSLGVFSVEQINNSTSKKGVLRGVHFKNSLEGQAKFVSVHAGAIYDIAIDLRKSSATFGKWQGFFLSSSNNKSLLLAKGIGHVFLSLEDETKVSYLCSTSYEPEKEVTVNPLSFDLNLAEVADAHSVGQITMSSRDREAPPFSDSQHLWPD